MKFILNIDSKEFFYSILLFRTICKMVKCTTLWQHRLPVLTLVRKHSVPILVCSVHDSKLFVLPRNQATYTLHLNPERSYSLKVYKSLPGLS